MVRKRCLFYLKTKKAMRRLGQATPNPTIHWGQEPSHRFAVFSFGTPGWSLKRAFWKRTTCFEMTTLFRTPSSFPPKLLFQTFTCFCHKVGSSFFSRCQGPSGICLKDKLSLINEDEFKMLEYPRPWKISILPSTVKLHPWARKKT